MRKILVFILVLCSVAASAQVGEFRKDFAVGVNGGYVLSNVDFVPKVPQGYAGGNDGRSDSPLYL